MLLHLTRTGGTDQDLQNRVFNIVSDNSHPFHFHNRNNPLDFNEDPYAWNDLFKAFLEYREEHQIPPQDFLIVLTDLQNDQNWFSAFDPHHPKNIFIQTSEWEDHLAIPPVYAVSYEVIANLIYATAFIKDGQTFWNAIHDHPLGCINDMCSWKADFILKIRTGDICADCMQLYRNCLSDDELEYVFRKMEEIRVHTLYKTETVPEFYFDKIYPFPIAVAKRRMASIQDPKDKLDMLIYHFDTMLRTTVLITGLIVFEELPIFLEECHLDKNPTLGSWRYALRKIRSQRSMKYVDYGLPITFNKNLSEIIKIEDFYKIVDLRNENAHSFESNRDKAIQYYNATLPGIRKIEKQILPLFKEFRMLYIHNSSNTAPGQVRIEADDMTGSNDTFNRIHFEQVYDSFENMPFNRHCYFVNTNRQIWIDLHPYLQYSKCGICKHNRLLIYDGCKMIDSLIGHRTDLPTK